VLEATDGTLLGSEPFHIRCDLDKKVLGILSSDSEDFIFYMFNLIK
jgi:hypothetical protein